MGACRFCPTPQGRTRVCARRPARDAERHRGRSLRAGRPMPWRHVTGKCARRSARAVSRDTRRFRYSVILRPQGRRIFPGAAEAVTSEKILRCAQDDRPWGLAAFAAPRRGAPACAPAVRRCPGAGRGTTQGSFPTGEESAAHGEYRPLRDAMANDKITAPEASASGAVIFIFLPVYFPAFI